MSLFVNILRDSNLTGCIRISEILCRITESSFLILYLTGSSTGFCYSHQLFECISHIGSCQQKLGAASSFGVFF